MSHALSEYFASITEKFGGSNTIAFSNRCEFAVFSGTREQWEAIMDSAAHDLAADEGAPIPERVFLMGGRKIPTALAKPVPESELSELDECSICKNDLFTSSAIRLPCKHVYHELCLALWFKHIVSTGWIWNGEQDDYTVYVKVNCPYCRASWSSAPFPICRDDPRSKRERLAQELDTAVMFVEDNAVLDLGAAEFADEARAPLAAHLKDLGQDIANTLRKARGLVAFVRDPAEAPAKFLTEAITEALATAEARFTALAEHLIEDPTFDFEDVLDPFESARDILTEARAVVAALTPPKEPTGGHVEGPNEGRA